LELVQGIVPNVFINRQIAELVALNTIMGCLDAAIETNAQLYQSATAASR